MERSSVFRDHGKARLYKPVDRLFKESGDYPTIDARLPALLRLADRLTARFESDPECALAPAFVKAVANDDDDERPRAMVSNIELWLKAVLAIVKPELVAKWKRDDKRDNLIDAITALDLVPSAVFKRAHEEAQQDLCPVQRAIFDAQSLRNHTTHRARGQDNRERDQMRDGAAAMVLATLARHENRLREGTRRVLWPLADSPFPRQVCGAMAQERNFHLSAFEGRRDWLERLDEAHREMTANADARMVVISGPQGHGKSALLAKWTALLAQQDGANEAPRSDWATEAPPPPPWLPGSLLHLGKESGDPVNIAESLLWQANALLLEPEGVPRRDAEARAAMRPRPATRHKTVMPPSATWPTTTRPDWGSESTFDVEVAWSTDATPVNPDHWRMAVQSALTRLVQERGPTVVVIDAIDEILRASEKGLTTLPETWPRGVLVVFSVRTGEHLERIHRRWPTAETWDLTAMSAGDVAAVLQLEPDDARAATFAKEAGGWAQAIRDLRKQRDEGCPVEGLRTRASAEIFGEMAGKWEGALEDLLLLLALLEPCAHLRMEDLKSWLAFAHGLKLHGPALRRLLSPVREQLAPHDGVDGVVRLVQSMFAEHVRTKVFLRSDLQEGFERILQWLAATMPDNDVLLVGPLLHWSAAWQLKTAQSEGMRQFFEALFTHPEPRDYHHAANHRMRIVRGSIEKLQRNLYMEGARHAANHRLPGGMSALGMELLKAHEAHHDPVEGRRWLQSGAETGDPTSMLSLGQCLFFGIGMTKDTEEGLKWLRRAADMDCAPAMANLGSMYLYGNELVTTNRDEATTWLRRSANLGDPFGMRLLAEATLDEEIDAGGDEEARMWLRKAADRDDKYALYRLGIRLLDGKKFVVDPSDPSEGQRCLRKAAELGATFAQRELGIRLLDGNGVEKDSVEGRRWLLKAAEQGDESAQRVLGMRFLDGDGVEKDSVEGRRWLLKAAEQGDENAQTTLGTRLLDGNGVERDSVEGFKWLHAAAESGWAVAQWELGRRLLDGMSMNANPEEGERWLRQSANKEPFAMYDLGRRLLDGVSMNANPEEGERWLRQSANKEPSAMYDLGRRLLEGSTLESSPAEGESLIRKAAQADFPLAAWDLGRRLLDGDRIPGDPREGEQWLRRGANVPYDRSLGFVFGLAKADLGNRLIEGNGLTKDPAEGERWLRKAAEENHALGMVYLGAHLLDGHAIAHDPTEGEEWLRRATKEHHELEMRPQHAVAMWELGRRLLLGVGLKRNPEEGTEWLRRAAELSNAEAIQLFLLMNFLGVIVDHDSTAEQLARRAADAGNAASADLLGEALLNGIISTDDPSEGERWLRKAADAACASAMRRLGCRLLEGAGVNVNLAEGEQWLRKAAEANDAEAMGELGWRLLEGIRLPAAAEEGEQWLRKGVAAKDPRAMLSLARWLRSRDPDTDRTAEAQQLLDAVTEQFRSAMQSGATVWTLADPTIVMTRLAQTPGVVDGDVHLLIAWLCSTRNLADPEGLTLAERMDRARRRGYDFPPGYEAILFRPSAEDAPPAAGEAN